MAQVAPRKWLSPWPLLTTWVTEPVGTSSRAKVDSMDLAIAFSILKFCSQKMNSDGTMPTARIKGIWDQMFENGEVDRAFDYHRWRVIRNLIEAQGGLEMEDRHFYTGFVNDQGHEIRGLAAKWRMADWLVEKLEELFSYGFIDQASGLSPSHRQGESLLEQQQPEDQAEILLVSPVNTQGGSLLEQELEQDDDYGFDRDWIVEFRQSEPPMIGLIWGGSVQNIRRDAG